MTMIRTERRGSVLRVVLDRPATLNALRRTDIDAVTACMRTDADVTAVVFAGAGGRAFSAGVDISEFLELDAARARTFIDALRTMVATVRTAPVATICEIDGYCIGGAFELALACDLRVATARSSVALPEIKLGIPSVIDAALLQQHVGLAVAKEMILTGDRYPVTEPRLATLFNRVIDQSALSEAVDELLSKVSGHTPTVLAAQKRLFETWQNSSLVQGAADSVEEFAAVFEAQDTIDALAHYRASVMGSNRGGRGGS